MAIPPYWVRQHVQTGEIQCDGDVVMNLLPYQIRGQRGSFIWNMHKYAVTAEAALERGWTEMAAAWRDEHDCPFDCPMNLCSSEECPLVKENL